MKGRTFAKRVATIILAAGITHGVQAAETLRSPDRAVEVQVDRSAEGNPTYAVWFKGEPVLLPSDLGLRFRRVEGGRLFDRLVLKRSQWSQGADDYALPVGKVAHAHDPYNELTLDYQEEGGQGRKLQVIFRAYPNGVAFRYRMPAPSGQPIKISGEVTGFNFAGNYQCWGLNLGHFGTSHEGEYDPVRADKMRPFNLFELPLRCDTGKARFALAEADLRSYAGLYLTGRDDGGYGVQAKLSPRLDDPTLAVVSDGDLLSPWRVVMLGESDADLIESTLITSLNPPSIVTDTSWIKPGKAAWDWWSGPVLDGVPQQPGTSDKTLKEFIDFAAEAGLPYMMVDEGWYASSGWGGTLKPGADPLVIAPGLDFHGIVDYAAKKNVGLLVWVHWKLLDGRMDEVLSTYQRWGIKGIKVDFMDRDDQQMVDYYHRLLETAAKYKLMVNLHGAYRPTGLIRTYPHFVTQEGVLGAEYNKWTRRITASHNVTLAFTRMLLGPMDYTPGGFRNVTPAAFKPQINGPMVMTTRAHQLAMYVVYDSPLSMAADTPDAYRGAAGLDFLSQVPTSWDETRLLAGEIGQYIVVARRKGKDWHIGAMGNEAGRLLSVPLDRLPAGRFIATLRVDGDQPDQLTVSQRPLETGPGAAPLSLTLAPGGGAAVVLRPR